MEASQQDRDQQWAYELDQQIRALSTMCSLVMDKFPDSSNAPTQTNGKHREAMALSVLLAREPGEIVTVAAAVDALSSRPYHELVVATNMEQDVGSSNYKHLFAPGEITDCDVLPDYDSALTGFDRHVKVFGTLLRAYHGHFEQPAKRAKFKRAFLTYALGAGLPEFVHRLSFGVRESSFVSFLVNDLPPFGEDFERLVFLEKEKPKISSMGVILVESAIGIVQQSLLRKEGIEIDDAYLATLELARESLKKGEFDYNCAYAIHIILRIRLRWVFQDIERALSLLSIQEAPQGEIPEELHWTTTLLQWDLMVSGLKEFLDMYGGCIDILKDRETLKDRATLKSEDSSKNGDTLRSEATLEHEDALKSEEPLSTALFSTTTHPHLSALFKNPHPPPNPSSTPLPSGTALTTWLRDTTSAPRAAQNLLHPRCASLAALASHLTILPLTPTPPIDRKMARYKSVFSLLFPPSVLPRGLYGWPAQLKTHLSGDDAFRDLWQRRFTGAVPQEAQVLMRLAGVERLRPPSRAMPVVAGTRVPGVGAAVVVDAVVEVFWGRPWREVREAEPGRRKKEGETKKRKAGVGSGVGSSGVLGPVCVPEGLPGKVVEGIRDVVLEEVRARIGVREVGEGLSEGVSEELRELNEKKRRRGQGSLMRHREKRGEEGRSKRKAVFERMKEDDEKRKRAKWEEGERNRAAWERYQAEQGQQAEQGDTLQAGDGANVEQKADIEAAEAKVKQEVDEEPNIELVWRAK
ncbi:hypothetical protein BU16DRAFT_537947 [Lophium mytilinum]|uniref:Uncharacterized protein n=1 Tax=Lophium mytilinum TaxID=390894 RepID=A0A6A6QWJ8_9PEZI|nr:hypothetical protein BU16DRAFT_537947 [Lophium mytilinum]